MIAIRNDPQLIAGHDPKVLLSELEDLERSEGWKFVVEVLGQIIERKREQHWRSIEPGRDGGIPKIIDQLCNANKNYYVGQSLVDVVELVPTAKALCATALEREGE